MYFSSKNQIMFFIFLFLWAVPVFSKISKKGAKQSAGSITKLKDEHHIDSEEIKKNIPGFVKYVKRKKGQCSKVNQGWLGWVPGLGEYKSVCEKCTPLFNMPKSEKQVAMDQILENPECISFMNKLVHEIKDISESDRLKTLVEHGEKFVQHVQQRKKAGDPNFVNLDASIVAAIASFYPYYHYWYVINNGKESN